MIFEVLPSVWAGWVDAAPFAPGVPAGEFALNLVTAAVTVRRTRERRSLSKDDHYSGDLGVLAAARRVGQRGAAAPGLRCLDSRDRPGGPDYGQGMRAGAVARVDHSRAPGTSPTATTATTTGNWANCRLRAPILWCDCVSTPIGSKNTASCSAKPTAKRRWCRRAWCDWAKSRWPACAWRGDFWRTGGNRAGQFAAGRRVCPRTDRSLLQPTLGGGVVFSAGISASSVAEMAGRERSRCGHAGLSSAHYGTTDGALLRGTAQ